MDIPVSQPVGAAVPNFVPPAVPGRVAIKGRYAELVPLAGEHFDRLHEAFAADVAGAGWTYLPYGPFASVEAHRAWLAPFVGLVDPLFFTIVPTASGVPGGLIAYLRIMPEAGSIEIGHVHFGPGLQRTAAATEAVFLLIDGAFALGYRRVEWKCDALNAASRQAALRLGFTYEGTFRWAGVYKGRNRDTAWFAIISPEWERLRGAFLEWLAPGNFSAEGVQGVALGELIGRAVARE